MYTKKKKKKKKVPKMYEEKTYDNIRKERSFSTKPYDLTCAEVPSSLGSLTFVPKGAGIL